MEETIDLKSLLRYFYNNKKRLLYIVLIIFLLGNILFFALKGFVYSSVGKVKITVEATSNKISSYNDLILSDTILDKVVEKSNAKVDKATIKKNLSLTANIGSRIYTITLNYHNREDGNEICNTIVSEFIARVETYDGNRAILYDAVSTSNNPININLLRNEILYVFIGLIVSFVYLFVLFYYDKKIKSQGELDKLNVLGTINDSNSISLIKTKIKLSDLGNVVLLNTAKKINCKNDVFELIKEFAKDSKVLFIDTNIRNKSKELGYSDLLSNYKEDYSKYISKKDNYEIMESGTKNSEVEVLLSSKNNEKLIKDLKKKYDYVILYNSDSSLYSDSLILSKLADANYIIVGINQTEKNDLSKAFDVYKQVNSEVNGIIIIDKEPEIKIFKKFSI